MLKNIPNILSPDLLKILMEIVHGDVIDLNGIQKVCGIIQLICE